MDDHRTQAQLLAENAVLRQRLAAAEATIQALHTGDDVRDKAATTAAHFQTQLLDAVDQAVIATDLDGRILHWNQAAEQLYGWPRDEVIGRNILGVTVSPAQVEQASAIMAALRQGRRWSGEFWVEHRDGTIFPAFVVDSPILNVKGALVGIAGMSHDVTPQRQTEAALRESEERFRGAFDFAVVGMALVAPDGRFLRVNHALCDMVGYAEDELMATTFQAITHPDDLETDLAHMHRLLGGEIDTYQMEKRYVHKHGSVVWVLLGVRLVRTPQGEPLHMVAQIQDISARKRAEQQVADTLDFNQRLLEASPLGIATYGATGQCVSANAAAARIVGATLEQYRGQNFRRIASWRQSGLLATAEAALAAEAHQQCEIHITTTFGEQVWLDCRLVRFDAGGEPHLLLLFDDITERKEAENRLAALEDLYRRAIAAADAVPYRKEQGAEVFTFMGEGIKNLTGYTPQELTKTLWDELAQEDVLRGPLAGLPVDEALCRFRQDENDIWMADSRILTKQGEERWIADVSVELRDEQGKPIGSIGLLQDITERKQAEAVLGAERSLLRTLIDSLPDRIYVKDTAGRFTVDNQADVHQLGATSSDAVIGKTVFDFFPHEIAQRFHADDQVVIQSGRPLLNREEAITDAAGNLGWVLTSKIPLRDSQGKVVGLVGISRDVTERKQAEAVLAAERSLLRTLIDSLPDRIYVQDTAGRFTVDNQAAAHQLGAASSDAVIGKTVFDFFPHEIAQRAHADDQTILRSGRPLLNREEAIPDAAGNLSWLLTTKIPLRDPQGKVIGLVGISRDITERKQVEAALVASETRYRAVVDGQAELICRFRPDGVMTFANDAYCRYFDLDRDGVVGATFAPVVPDQESEYVWQQFTSLSPERPTSSYEHRVILPGDDMRWNQWTNRAIFDQEGQVVEYQAVGRDVTPLREAEEQLRRQAMRLQIVAEASKLFAEQTFAYPAVLDIVARNVAGWIGSACMIQLLAADGQLLESTTISDQDPATMTFVRAFIDKRSPRVSEHPFLLHILETGQPVLIPTLDRAQVEAMFEPQFRPALGGVGVASLIVAPMRVQGRTIGLLSVARRRQEAAAGRPKALPAEQAPFDKDDLILVQDLADRAALTITNARLYAEAQGRLKQLQALRAIDTAILGTRELAATLDVVVEQVAAQLGIDAVDILLLDQATQELVYAAGAGFRSDAIRRSRLHLGEGTAGRAAQKRQIEYRLDWDADIPFARSALLAAEDFVSYYSVPLVAHDRVQGVLDLFHRAPLASAVEWLALLEALALQAAVAIEQARLFSETRLLLEQTQAQARQLEQILNTVPEGVVLLDGAQRIVAANPVAQIYLARLEHSQPALPQVGDKTFREASSFPEGAVAARSRNP